MSREATKWIDTQIEQLKNLAQSDNSDTSIQATIKLKRFMALSPEEKYELANSVIKSRKQDMKNLKEAIKENGIAYLKGKRLIHISTKETAYISDKLIDSEILNYKDEPFEVQSRIKRFYGSSKPNEDMVFWIYTSQWKIDENQ